MAKYLDGVTANTVGSLKKTIGPTTIFVESTNYGGGTVTLYAARSATGTKISLGTYTANDVVNDTIIGVHYLSATLSGATNPAAVTVATVAV